MSALPRAVYVAIGSNIDPHKSIPHCLDLLRQQPETQLGEESSWYRTAPWGMEEQADFINLVIELETRLSPWDLLKATQGIEHRLGRVRTIKNGPRTIDLDILLFGDLRIHDPRLQIPHPGLEIRDFMLTPLIEIAPEAMHPGLGLPVHALTSRLRHRQILEKLPARHVKTDELPQSRG